MRERISEAEKRAIQAEDLSAFQGFKLLSLRNQIQEVLTQFGRHGLFEEYTKHDISHLDEMLKIYDWLVPESSKRMMSPADWLLLVCSTYLHDLGLVVTRAEYANRMASGYAEYRESLLNADDADGRDYRAYLNTLTSFDRDRFIYQEFVRTHHAARVRSWLQERPDPQLGYDSELGSQLKSLLTGLEPVFVTDIGIVCESHHLEDLHDTSRYPASRPYGNSSDETANVQYAAICLRAADLLHITRDRTPSIAFKLINPSNPDSQREWAKQNSVRAVRSRMGHDRDGNPDPSAPRDTVEVHAKFEDEEGYFGLTAYLKYAEKQLQQCYAWATNSNRKQATQVEFPWRYIDLSHVEASGFIPKQFDFTLDEGKILDLLTGHTLYNDSSVVVRETVQNALDAVRLQAYLSSCGCEPRVMVNWNSEERLLEVTDNGTGMTQDIIEQNFLRVGASRYQESSFQRENPGFSPISRFGIGVLSTFMISDEVEVITCSLEEDKGRQISLRSVHGQYLIRLIDKDDSGVPPLISHHRHGTLIRIRVRLSADLSDVLAVMRRWVVVPRAEVLFSMNGGEQIRIGYPDLKSALTDVLRGLDEVEQRGESFYTRWHEKIEIRTADSEDLELAYTVKWSPFFKEWSFWGPAELMDDARSRTAAMLSGDRGSQERVVAQLGIAIEGIRVETGCPGFPDGSIAAIVNVSGKRAPRTNVARTALENTAELDSFLLKLYRGYCNHLVSEVKEIVDSRGFSVTKASGQMQYLVRPIAAVGSVRSREGASASQRLLGKALREIPSLVIERGGSRELIPVAELESAGGFVTFDSTMIRRLESLLAELPGAITLGDIARLGGVRDSLPWETSLPRLCSGTSSIFARLWRREWEPSDIRVTDNSVLTVEWARVSEEGARWSSLLGARVLGRVVTTGASEPLQYLAVYTERFIEGANSRERGVYVPNQEVSIVGLEEFDAAVVHSELYVLPRCPVVDVKFHEGVSDADRIFAQSALVWLLVSVHERRLGALRRSSFRGLMEDLQRIDMTSLMAQEDFDQLLSYEFRIFDISEWDRGPVGDGFY